MSTCMGCSVYCMGIVACKNSFKLFPSGLPIAKSCTNSACMCTLYLTLVMWCVMHLHAYEQTHTLTEKLHVGHKKLLSNCAHL